MRNRPWFWGWRQWFRFGFFFAEEVFEEVSHSFSLLVLDPVWCALVV
jgi:hypothetical protein